MGHRAALRILIGECQLTNNAPASPQKRERGGAHVCDEPRPTAGPDQLWVISRPSVKFDVAGPPGVVSRNQAW